MIRFPHVTRAGIGLSGGVLMLGLAATPATAPYAADQTAKNDMTFNRVVSFPVVRNLPAGTPVETETSAEIIVANTAGDLLAYSDSPFKAIGLVDISSPTSPQPAGIIQLDGEPTAVVFSGEDILVSINTSTNFVSPSGMLAVYDTKESQLLSSCELGGQPDSVALSPDGSIVAVAIENERDEDLNDGELPQLPAGFLSIYPLRDGLPICADVKQVSLLGLADIGGDDPEPEFVAINQRNEIAVTMQENNHIVIVDGNTGNIIQHFNAGSVDLENVDIDEEGALTFDASQPNRPREPDAVKWLDDDRLVTANEGDYRGGSRGFTIFSKSGDIQFDSGLDFEYAVAMAGHYPEKRSGNKGVEPEGIEVGVFGDERVIVVLSERGSVAGIYRDEGAGNSPTLLQLLPSGVGPESAVAIPSRNLLVTANEADIREDGGPGSHIMIFERTESAPVYPQLVSTMNNGRPIGWGALSGLAADPVETGILYAVSDSFYSMQPAIFTIDANQTPAQITHKRVVNRAGAAAQKLDLEGIASDGEGGFWLASEGRADRLIPHALYHVDSTGQITDEVALPDKLNAVQKRFGLEGLTISGSGDDTTLWIALQREWQDDPEGLVKILSYRPADGIWSIAHYPLEKADGGWIGLSSIEVRNQQFFVIERDNQLGEKARIKRLYGFGQPAMVELSSNDPVPVIDKKLVRDLLPDLKLLNGPVVDKVEGFAINVNGEGFVVTDNDGVDDHSGETLFFSVGKLAEKQLVSN
ncbi:MAG: esterase-like activity of phytase family protein [Granulosicoccus sp.]|nr:esterase-like activity of phytase family protein [Granulosicoccus sp.]